MSELLLYSNNIIMSEECLKSLKSYYNQFKPRISIRTSLAHFKKEDWIVNIPLYAIREIRTIISEQ